MKTNQSILASSGVIDVFCSCCVVNLTSCDVHLCVAGQRGESRDPRQPHLKPPPPFLFYFISSCLFYVPSSLFIALCV